ncbi:hypothetical protein BDQ94DRAFT_169871 [Aspergillus welwitschiae]|uniref:Uncharacterized protein n=1 Tax=Aspergillus welwitschiae TaxID=1341132 RepID=A0A3F3Q3Y2_9EURO|nr:hypothetical protein BDQ94DRAFT_169871 [Aspergillus welwitschiae]RDH33795.1 hypothetical protein BDQ94DRAFT_169871 [Aspergillus welwitschiae]
MSSPPPSYELSIQIFGPGEDPHHRSHWGFLIAKPSSPTGDLLHVQVIHLDNLWYQFEARINTPLRTMETMMQAVGKVKLATLGGEQQRQQAIEVITASPAPRDGRKRFQDWVLDTLLSLEVEEVVPAGTCHFWEGLVGRSAAEVRERSGVEWVGV